MELLDTLAPGQEIAGAEAEGAALDVGPAKLRIGGYLGVTGVYRSTNSGGGSRNRCSSCAAGRAFQPEQQWADTGTDQNLCSQRGNDTRENCGGRSTRDFGSCTQGINQD